MSMSPEQEPWLPELLETLDVIVSTDRAPSGLSGTVAIGICKQHETSWWQVHLDRVACTRQLTGFPVRADAVLLLGLAESRAIAAGTELPEPSLIEVTGDERLLRSFVDRYLGGCSPLDLRILHGRRS